MRNFVKASQLIFVGTLLTLNTAFAAGNAEVKIGDMIAGGPGCVDSNVGIYPRSDKGLTLFYRDFFVALPEDKPIARAQCSVQVSYDYVGERQFAVKNVRLYFTNKIDASKGKVIFNVMNVDPVNGSTVLANAEKEIDRKGYQSLVIETKNNNLVWSPCQSSSSLLQYKAEARLNQGDSIKVRHAFINLVSRPC